MELADNIPAELAISVAETMANSSFESMMITGPGDSDSAGAIVYVNEAFTTLTGYTAEDVVGKSPAILQGVETDQTVLDQLRDDLRSGHVFEGKTTNYRKDGTSFTMHWRVAPISKEGMTGTYHIAVQRCAD